MENVKLKLKLKNTLVFEYTPISFRFIRERYTPYTQLVGTVIGDVEMQQVAVVELYYNGRLLHKGMPDSFTKRYKNGRYIISFMSRGYTMLLGQNEPEPGVIRDVNLGGIIEQNISGIAISWEVPTDQTNYIYVKEKSTIWDAICTYAYKVYHNYPYIKNHNSIYVSVPSNPTSFNYNVDTIVSQGEGLSTSGVLTKLYMKDTDGAYSFSQDNSMSTGYGIIRKKYYPLDMQWLSDPEDGLKSKLYYSNRGMRSKFIVYPGHKFENLMDRATYTINSDMSFSSRYICGVEFYGNKNGVFTKITVYYDSYH